MRSPRPCTDFSKFSSTSVLVMPREQSNMNTSGILSQNSKICIIVLPQSIQPSSHVQLSLTSWTAACQTSLFITNSRSLLKLTSIESMMPSNCRPLLLPPSIFPSNRVFSSESVLHIKWPKYWSFSFNISPSNKYSGLISFRIDTSIKNIEFYN